MDTYTNLRPRAQTHTHIHTFIHTYMHEYMDMNTIVRLRAQTHTYIHTYIRVMMDIWGVIVSCVICSVCVYILILNTHTYIHTYIQVICSVWVYTCLHSHTHTHTYIHTYTHTGYDGHLGRNCKLCYLLCYFGHFRLPKIALPPPAKLILIDKIVT